MNENGVKSLLANPLPIVMVVLLAAGVFVKIPPLRSARPPEPERAKYVATRLQDVEARLWQDPFAAVSRAKAGAPSESPHSHEAVHKQIEDLRNLGRSVTILAVSVRNSAYAEDAESRRRTRYAVVSALGFYGYLPDKAEAIGYFGIDLTEREASDSCGNSPPAPDGRRLPLSVPFEFFDRSRSDVLVLWLDEDKLALTDSPQKSLYDLFECLTPTELRRPVRDVTQREPAHRPIQWRMVGPAGSEMLTKLGLNRLEFRYAADLERPKGDRARYSEPLVFASGATISHCNLDRAWRRALRRKRLDNLKVLDGKNGRDEGEWLDRARAPKVPRHQWNCFSDENNDRFMEYLAEQLAVIRTTGTDDVLAAALLWELARRGVDIYRVPAWSARPWGWLIGRDPAPRCGDGLVLISQWDTEYGRALVRNLTDGFSKGCGPGAGDDDRRVTRFTRAAEPVQVRQFNYLRGLDGALPDLDKPNAGKDDGAKTKDDGAKTKDSRAQLDDVPKEHAEGRSQYDYLRRLADEIARLDDDATFARNGVKAIGIVGNDVYDKLLILQALRGRFKDKILFTTDLDARYLHVDQKDWARNLVVASNFGLSLRPALQQATPPFRDSYQTATYLAALMALDDTGEGPRAWSRKISEWLRPQLFEIGRTEAVHLASPSPGALTSWIKGENPEGIAPAADDTPCSGDLKDCGNIDPAWPRRRPSAWTMLALFAMGILAIGLTVVTSRRAQAMMRATTDEPVTALGVLGAAALVLVIVAMVVLFLRFELAQGVGEPFVWLEGVSVWPSLVLRFAGLVTTIILAIGFMVWMRRQTGLIAERFELGVPRTGRLARGWRSAAWIGPHVDFASFDASGTPDPKARAAEVEIDTLWQNYLWATSLRAMGAWIILSCLLVFALGFLTFQLLGRPAFPHRGRLVEILHWLLLFSTAGTLWLVIFWVGYETRAGARFIQTLSDVRSVWPESLLRREEKDTRVPRAYLDDYLDFQLVVAAARRIHGLIYVPFVSIVFPVVARSDLFDAMGFPPALMFVTGLALAYAFYSAVLLRRSAEAARAKALDRYEMRLLAESRPDQRPQSPGAADLGAAPTSIPRAADIPPPVSTEQIKLLMDRIRRPHEGAFAPLLQQPAVRALLLPFGGYGGAELILYLISFTA